MKAAAKIALVGLFLYASVAVGILTAALTRTSHGCNAPLTFGDGVTFAAAMLAFIPVAIWIGERAE